MAKRLYRAIPKTGERHCFRDVGMQLEFGFVGMPGSLPSAVEWPAKVEASQVYSDRRTRVYRPATRQ
jgi:hypothetical protein